MSFPTVRALGLFGVPLALLPLTPESPVLAALVLVTYVALLRGAADTVRPSKGALVYASVSALYLCFALFASLPTSDYGLQKVLFVLLIILPFAIMVSSLIREPDDIRYILYGALSLGVIVAAGTSLTLNRDFLGPERYQWLGNICAFAAVIALQGWVVKRKLMIGAIFLLTLAGVAISAARQSVVLLAIGWIVILFVRMGDARRALGYICISLITIGLLVTQIDRIVQLPIAAVMVERLGVLVPSTGGFTLLQRGLLFQKAWNCYVAHPFTGVGIGHYADFPGYTAEMTGDVHAYPHNIVLEVLCEQGTIGFVILLLPLVVAAWTMFRLGSLRSGEPYVGALILFTLAATTAGITGDLMSRPIWIYGILMIRLTMLRPPELALPQPPERAPSLITASSNDA